MYVEESGAMTILTERRELARSTSWSWMPLGPSGSGSSSTELDSKRQEILLEALAALLLATLSPQAGRGYRSARCCP